MSVDLPAPVRPTMPICSPGLMSIDKARSTGFPSNAIVAADISILPLSPHVLTCESDQANRIVNESLNAIN